MHQKDDIPNLLDSTVVTVGEIPSPQLDEVASVGETLTPQPNEVTGVGESSSNQPDEFTVGETSNHKPYELEKSYMYQGDFWRIKRKRKNKANQEPELFGRVRKLVIPL